MVNFKKVLRFKREGYKLFFFDMLLKIYGKVREEYIYEFYVMVDYM